MSKQQTTSTGRVIPEREKVANDLLKLLDFNKPLSIDVDELVKYVMTEKNSDFYRGERSGHLQGHKEAGVMFLSAFEAELSHMPKPKPTLGGLGPTIQRAVLAAAKRAVEAITKATEETK